MYMCKCTLGVWHRVNMAHWHLSLSKCGNMIRSIHTGEPNLELVPLFAPQTSTAMAIPNASPVQNQL